MPIYVYVCECGKQFDVYKKIKDIDSETLCECGLEAKRKIVPTMVNFDMQPWEYYESPVSGKPIRSYKDRREDMKTHGCVDYEPSMKKVQRQKIDQMDKELDKKVDETVEREWDKMPTHKREKLANELMSGADVQFERK